MSVVNNPGVIIIVTGILIICLLMLKTHSQCYCGDVNGRIYRMKSVDILETICYINMLLFCLARLFVLDSFSEEGQIILGYVSGGITFALFVVVIFFHLFKESLYKITAIFKQALTKKEVINKQKVFDNDDHVTQNPTHSDLSSPPQGEKPLSALVEERLKQPGDSHTVHCEVKRESYKEEFDELTPLLDDNESHSD